MGRIQILPEHEARKIAAGEVVERPASVAKELLENAIDAGATEITLAVHDGGRSSLMMRDNGCGMSREDAKLSVEHHATSKIRSVDELTSIETFGFRGEALSSIASVSKLTLITREENAQEGYQLILHAGTLISEGAVAANKGTCISIEDLFYNVPARKKFVKQRDTEWRAIYQLMQAYALAYPQIAFTLSHDGNMIWNARQSDTLLERAAQIFERDVAQHMFSLELYTTQNVTISGIVTDHQCARYDRRLIFSFVNGRWVKNTILSKALIAAYHHVLPAGKSPANRLILMCTHVKKKCCFYIQIS
jgi:DNA mismatch repair protein MutL